eukprot:TRINITY_DN395_c0_g1_i2.p1 TRINITY_DN395_c0_g1~~TRINITY_DN395_c0_g1_i2.p1  ORF type:complete len:750 (-),score=152.45 TRINITY_DN395_c0_g1_i2:1539-3788(-)
MNIAIVAVYVLNILGILGIIVFTILSAVTFDEFRNASNTQRDTYFLASELRVSSDDLTRFIRTYTVTSNHSFWVFFNDVIHIRDGLIPLPLRPNDILWDRIIAEGRPPRAADPAYPSCPLPPDAPQRANIRCGGPEGWSCFAGEYCFTEETDACGRSGAYGVCRPLPSSCPDAVNASELVCACSLADFPSACHAAAAGLSVAYAGSCKAGPPGPPNRTCASGATRERGMSITERMIAAGFTSEEMELLTEAKRQSDALIDMENVAAHAMLGWYREEGREGDVTAPFVVEAAPNATYAALHVNGNAYHIWKGRIMVPIEQFFLKADGRVNDRLDVVHQRGVALVCVSVGSLLVFVVVQLVYILRVQRSMATQSLLSTILPARVVGMLSVGEFESQRALAERLARRMKQRVGQAGVPGAAGRPMSATSSSIMSFSDPYTHTDSLGNVDPLRPDAPRAASRSGVPDRKPPGFQPLFAETLPWAWVTFLDAVNFTSMCREAAAPRVVRMLNQLFSLLDVEAATHEVDKIKTIGDAYMAAVTPSTDRATVRRGVSVAPSASPTAPAGGPDPSSPPIGGHVSPALSARRHQRGLRDLLTPGEVAACTTSSTNIMSFCLGALEIATGVRQVRGRGGRGGGFVSLRCGLHCDLMAAGIVGFDRPLYDLFGDGVNTAARLESTGVAGRVHMLEHTMELVSPEMRSQLTVCARDEEVELKGIGPVRSVLVNWDASANGENSSGKLPNSVMVDVQPADLP